MIIIEEHQKDNNSIKHFYGAKNEAKIKWQIGICYLDLSKAEGWQIFSVNSQIVCILALESHTVSVTSTQFWGYSVKAAIDNSWMNENDYVAMKCDSWISYNFQVSEFFF